MAEKFDEILTRRFSIFVKATLFVVSNLAGIGLLMLHSSEKISEISRAHSREIADLKLEVLQTRADAMEKQMDEEFDWLYATKAEKLEIENLKEK